MIPMVANKIEIDMVRKIPNRIFCARDTILFIPGDNIILNKYTNFMIQSQVIVF